MSKNFIRFLALVLVFACMLVSCEKFELPDDNQTPESTLSLEYFKENLDIKYNVTMLDKNYLMYYEEIWKLDLCKNGAISGLTARHKHNNNEYSLNEIFIFECNSKADAKNLASYLMKTYLSSRYEDFDIKQKEQFVLFGDKGAILDAL